ncbi:MAG: AMP-binding protein, partial [Actinomycetota bacterium]|nr:AMP-binding protein [Actinomycetota bacterium]
MTVNARPDRAGHSPSAVTRAATATASTGAGPAAGGFTWRRARAGLDGLPGGRGLNIAHEAVDRHADGPLAGHVALRCVARDGRVSELSYADLKEQTSRFASLLASLGVGKGDRVCTLLGRSADLYVVALGTMKRT